MNSFFVIFFVMFCLLNRIEASNGISAEFGFCKEFEFSLGFRLEHENKGIPTAWEEFEAIEMMKSGSMALQLRRAKAINSFALVPGAPMIESDAGIPREYAGYRLVFISRAESQTKLAGNGRCALLADPRGQNSKQFRAYSVFFSEEVTQIILNQIEGFDPIKQPLAFEDLSPFERERQQYHDNVRLPDGRSLSNTSAEAIDKRTSRSELRPTKDFQDTNSTATKTHSWLEFLILVVTVGIVFFAIFWSKRRKSRFHV